VVRRILPFIRQHETHRQLVGRARPNVGRRRAGLNAIVVPASRPAVNLDHAVTLARAMDCQLLVLCSREARAAEVSELLAARCFTQAVVVDLPDSYKHSLLDFTSSRLTKGELPEVCENPNGDLSTKRNLGLLLARMQGWEHIFFMDDDIRDVASADLYSTVAMLGHYRSAGMSVSDFPDNSVVCHAHRVTGASQDIFVSGSVLAVNSFEATGFFPEVYNEDWLFFYEDARSRRLGWSDRNATQLHFDPFDRPQRAERQEFGDVLAEGLYALLHLGGGTTDATRDFWEDFLSARRRFLEGITERADPVSVDVRVKMLASVQAAMTCLTQIKPDMCDTYVKAWRDDLDRWTEDMKSIPSIGSVESAVRELGLEPAESGRINRVLSASATGRTKFAASGPVVLPQGATVDLLQGQWARSPRGRCRKGRAALLAPQPTPDAEPSRVAATFGRVAKFADLVKLQPPFPRPGRTEPRSGPLTEADGPYGLLTQSHDTTK
jgi:hypothetical protein